MTVCRLLRHSPAAEMHIFHLTLYGTAGYVRFPMSAKSAFCPDEKRNFPPRKNPLFVGLQTLQSLSRMTRFGPLLLRKECNGIALILLGRLQW